MAKRLGVLGYGLVGYAVAGATVPVMLLFFGGWWLPRTVDRGPSTSTAAAVALDLAAISIFALQHSLMARPVVKRRLPSLCERTTYVGASCASIILLLATWRPIGPVVWELGGAARAVAAGGFVLGFLLSYWAAFTLGHTELLGLRQAWRCAAEGDEAGTSPPQLRVRGIYTLVRHPLMSGLLLCLWCAPTFTTGRLLLASAMSLYIVIGTRYEERDLRARFGPTYDARVAVVPAFAPWRPAFRRPTR
jgi:protein-S-isoprenylcysteine O-methyltransferase Ste14